MRTHLAAVAAAAALGGAAAGYLIAPTPGDAAARAARDQAASYPAGGTRTSPGADEPGANDEPPNTGRQPPDTGGQPSETGGQPSDTDPRASNAKPRTPKTMHIALNMPAGDRTRAAALGYDLFDAAPDAGDLAALPPGGRALLWVGNTTCGEFAIASTREFTATVRRFARDPRVYGWYLSDEPNPADCPGIAARIRKRADIVHRHAPGQKAFASLTDWPMRALRPDVTHLDLIGLDPYPCRTDRACDLDDIDRMVRQADRAGFPRRMIVPVFQTFGQECNSGARQWRLPRAGELRAMLRRWDRFVRDPAFDISYSWGRQRRWACPTLADADGDDGLPDLQSVMRRHNTRPAAARTSAPSPAPTGPCVDED
ncbi:hypothetical protein [Spirillospora albida]|uniref:hypothetical protein n=1 Tax=Spirillospora albida TaxID=58123 RepID=UPI0004BFC803|nr:hypothetical protein [Spirillospora albida]